MVYVENSKVRYYAGLFDYALGSGSFGDEKDPYPLLQEETRKAIVVLLALKGPLTVKKMAVELGLSSTTILSHVDKMVRVGLLKEVEVRRKKYRQERYYDLDVVFLSRDEEEKLKAMIGKYVDILYETSKAVYLKTLSEAERWFKETLMSKHGYSLERKDLRHYLWQTIWRILDEHLVREGLIEDPLKTDKGWHLFLYLRKPASE